MALTQREAIQLGLLLLVVPVQYLLSGNLGPQRSQTLQQLKPVQDIWFKLQSWKVRWLQFVSWILRGKVSHYFYLSTPLPCHTATVSEVRIRVQEPLVFNTNHITKRTRTLAEAGE